MTIEEAIKHCEEKANGCSECASDHAQLAGWLKELVKLREEQGKYENALELTVRDSDKSGTDVWCHDCPYDDDSKLEHCWECGVEYYKRKAGIEVE